MIFEGNRYSRKGFLFKSFAMSAVVSPGPDPPVPPSRTALSRFWFLSLTDHRRGEAHAVGAGEV